jgi:SAM-dependent methyltransferase
MTEATPFYVPWGCPVCQTQLTEMLQCPSCGFQGRVANGMYYMHRSDSSWKQCEIETNGWISRSREVGVYHDNEDHFYLPDGRPHLREFYAESKAHIDAFLKLESLSGRLAVDLGASIGWVEAYILRQVSDAQLIALEVNDDHLCGLGRSARLKQHYKVPFVSVVGDMHYVPLADSSVDVVFSVDALHHFRELDVVFREVRRILRPGGKFYGLNEPDRPVGVDESAYLNEHTELELRHNIIERRPTVDEYLQAGESIHLRVGNRDVGLIQHVHTASLLLIGQKL